MMMRRNGVRKNLGVVKLLIEELLSRIDSNLVLERMKKFGLDEFGAKFLKRFENYEKIVMNEIET